VLRYDRIVMIVYPGINAMVEALVLVSLAGPCIEAQSSASRKYFDDGERALAAHHYGEAEKAYEKLAQLDPGSAEVHAKLGMIYFQERKFEKAATALREALRIKPGLPDADVFLAVSVSELGRFSEALPGLEKGFRRSTDSALKRMAGLQLERAYTGLQRDSKAVEVALELNRLYPDDPEVLYQTGRLFGNFAYLTMHRLAEVAPSSPWRHQGAAEAYESQGSYDLAIAEYKEVLAASPGRPGIHYRLGRALLARARQGDSHAEDLTEASKAFEQELELDPTNANAAYELAEIHRKAAEFDKARELFALALKYYPDFEEAQVGMGRVLLSLAKPGLALPHLEKAIALDPHDEVSYYQLAQAYGALGNAAGRQKALAEFRRLRDQKPKTEIVKNVFSSREVTKQELDQNAAP
jgi:tetratricopeptide (TPR) repeat protein